MNPFYPFPGQFWHQPVPFQLPLYPFHPAKVRLRQYPEVDPSIFMSSAQHMGPLLRDAGTLLNKMAESWKFSYDLMSAAQESDKQKVEQIIREAGIQIIPKITYDPDGLNLYFTTGENEMTCCHLTLQLRWN